jgi:hypothetical protein
VTTANVTSVARPSWKGNSGTPLLVELVAEGEVEDEVDVTLELEELDEVGLVWAEVDEEVVEVVEDEVEVDEVVEVDEDVVEVVEDEVEVDDVDEVIALACG